MIRSILASIAAALLFLSSVVPTINAQPPQQPIWRPTPEQLEEQHRQLEAERKEAEARLKSQTAAAMERGSAIRLTIEADHQTIVVPKDIESRLKAYESSQAAPDSWNRRWYAMEVDVLEKRQAELQDNESPATHRLAAVRLWPHSPQGRYVSRENAIRALGPPPKVAPRPSRPMEPKMILVFENVSRQPQRLYFGERDPNPQCLVQTFIRGEGIVRRISQTRYGSPSRLWLKDTRPVELQPGEVHRVPLNQPDRPFPVYFSRSGDYTFRVQFTSGVLPSQSF